MSARRASAPRRSRSSRGFARGLLAAALAANGCDYIAPPDPLALDPDVVSIAIILVGGQTRARLLAGHPHRPVSEPPPNITASLVGPGGWRAEFTRRTNPWYGCGGGPTFWPMPMVCLNAALPEPIREKAAYRLEGEGPKGSFVGKAVVPATPRILEPGGDTLRLSGTWLPIRYRAAPEVGTLRPQIFATFRVHPDSDRTESKWISVGSLDPAGQADTLPLPGFEQASLHLLGIGWNYTSFYWADRIRFPWPNFGVSGEGVYGYFDGAAESRVVRIIVE